MVQISLLAAALATASLFPSTIAHPGEVHTRAEVNHEIIKREILATNAKRSLEKCFNTEGAIALDQRAVARRSAKLAAPRRTRYRPYRTNPYPWRLQSHCSPTL